MGFPFASFPSNKSPKPEVQKLIINENPVYNTSLTFRLKEHNLFDSVIIIQIIKPLYARKFL